MRVLRKVAKRVRDKSRTASPVTLFAGAVTLVGIGLVLLTVSALFAPATVTVVVTGLIAAATLALVVVMWLSLNRRLRAIQAANERVEVTQRRILAAVEQQRLDNELRLQQASLPS